MATSNDNTNPPLKPDNWRPSDEIVAQCKRVMVNKSHLGINRLQFTIYWHSDTEMLAITNLVMPEPFAVTSGKSYTDHPQIKEMIEMRDFFMSSEWKRVDAVSSDISVGYERVSHSG